MKRQRSHSKSNKSVEAKQPYSGSVFVEQPKVKKKKECKPKCTKGTHKNLLDFPDELLLKFQSYLTYRSKCQCVETCKKLNQVYSDPSLWADMPVDRWKIEKDGMTELKTISRFAKVKRINLGNEICSKMPLQKLRDVLHYACWRNENGDSLESLDFDQNNLDKVSADLLKEAICSVENVNLEETEITTKQLNALFRFIPTKNTLKRINLKNNDLAKVSPELLKDVFLHLDFNLCTRWLTEGQLNALFSLFPTQNILKTIDLSESNLEDVSSELIRAFCHCEYLNLEDTNLNTTQLNTLFTFIPTQNILKRINLGENDLSEISLELLKEALHNLEEVNLNETELTTRQLTGLISFIPTKTTLKTVDLSFNKIGKVSPELLKTAVCHLENVKLEDTNLTTKQLNALFSFIPTQNILKKLNLSQNYPSKVPAELLKNAVCHIEDVNLSGTDLNTKQLNDLFAFIPTKKKLKRIDLCCNDGLYKVNRKLLIDAVDCLSYACLIYVRRHGTAQMCATNPETAEITDKFLLELQKIYN